MQVKEMLDTVSSINIEISRPNYAVDFSKMASIARVSYGNMVFLNTDKESSIEACNEAKQLCVVIGKSRLKCVEGSNRWNRRESENTQWFMEFGTDLEQTLAQFATNHQRWMSEYDPEAGYTG